MILDFNTDSDYNSFRKSFSTNSDLFFQTATGAASVRQGIIHAPAHQLYAPHRKDGISLEQKRAYINRLWACTNIIDGLYYQCARTLGLKDNALALFYALADGQPHSQKQICEEWLIPKTTVNTVIRELQRCQLYKEQPDNACHDAYRQLAAVFPTHAYTQLGRILLDGFGTIHPGGRYIDVEAPDLNGKPVRLSSLIRGKLALVDLWASWCSPCRAKSKSMLPIYEQYKDKGFTVVGIAREFKDTRALRKAVALDGYPWTQLVELDDKQKIWTKYMLGNAGGGLFLIDPQGTIIAINPTPEQVLEAVREHCR